MKYLFPKGNIPWHKGKTGVYKASTIKAMRVAHLGKKYKPMSAIGKANVAASKIGLKQSEESNRKRSLTQTGRKLTKDHSKRISDGKRRANAERRALLGIEPEDAMVQIRHSYEYRLWRQSVFLRDDFTCQWCGQRGGKLHADHIKSFALHPELRFERSNGRTLCVLCHRKTDTWGAKSIQKGVA